MSDLLTIGRSGVLAYQGALASVGQNVANADTDGYARRTVVMKEQSATGGAETIDRSGGAFGGVQAAQVSRVWDQYKAANAWSASSDSSRASTRANTLSAVETALGAAGSDLGTKLTAVFTRASQIAADPGDATLRQGMLAAVSDAAAGFRQTGGDLAKLADGTRSQAATLVQQTNDQLAVLAKVNLALHGSAEGSAARAQLEDQRDTLIGSISANVALDVTLDGSGAATLRLSGQAGTTLLVADQSTAAYLTLATAADGRLSLKATADGASTAAAPTGGALAGLVDAAGTLAGRRQQLDALAAQFTTDLNGWQGTGLTPAGATGGALLQGTTAATIAPATTDPSAIAAATASGGEGGNLAALAALRGDGGVEAKWKGIVNGQALLVASANSEADATKTRSDGAATALDQVSGVDLDAEAAQLLRYQQAYSASAKIIQAARQSLQSILDLI